MKIGMSDTTARKVLAQLPANTTDQDLRQVRTRIEQQLKASVNGGHLNPSELEALIWAGGDVIDTVKGNPNPSVRVQVHAQNLVTAIPKLEALLARARTAAAGT